MTCQNGLVLAEVGAITTILLIILLVVREVLLTMDLWVHRVMFSLDALIVVLALIFSYSLVTTIWSELT